MLKRALVLLAVVMVPFALGCEDKPAEPAAPGGESAHTGHEGHAMPATAPAAAGAAAGGAAATEIPAGAGVSFLMPKEGSKVFETFSLAFAAANLTVTPAGEAVDDKSRGHHHVVVDGAPIPAGTVVPMDANNIHYGKGQTEAELKLAPGKHTLTLQFADGAHRSYGDALSSTIHVEVVPEPTAGKVFFVEPTDGAKVKGPVKMKFGVEGYTVRPAGEDAIEQVTGHHHVIVDGQPVPTGTVVPMDETHIHYGKGQTEAELTLSPGKHTLTLQFADGAHLSYGARLSQTITVEVE